MQALNEIHAAQSREDLSAEAKLNQLVRELDPLDLSLLCFWLFGWVLIPGIAAITYPCGLKQLDSSIWGSWGWMDHLLNRSQSGDFTEQDVNLASKKSVFFIKKCRLTHLNLSRALPELAPALFDFVGNVAVFPRPCPWSFGMMISNRQVWQGGSLGFWFQKL